MPIRVPDQARSACGCARVHSNYHDYAVVSGILPIIDRVFPLTGIAEAFAHQASQKHFGKICLSF